jgi:hypothetical protein
MHDEKICHADARLAHRFAAAQSERYARREYLPAVSGRISPCCNRMGKVTRDLAFKSRRPARVIRSSQGEGCGRSLGGDGEGRGEGGESGREGGEDGCGEGEGLGKRRGCLGKRRGCLGKGGRGG